MIFGQDQMRQQGAVVTPTSSILIISKSLHLPERIERDPSTKKIGDLSKPGFTTWFQPELFFFWASDIKNRRRRK